MKKLLIIFLLVNATICNAQKDSLDYQKIASRLDGSKPLNELVLQSAKLLLGNPYVGGTLDISDKETLVINFDKFDCVTFQETCSALALDAKSANPSYSNFKNKLESIRYRNGKINGYISRLHYSTDWINDNCKRNNVKDLTKSLGGIVLNKNINFMSTHAALYKHLNGNQLNIKEIVNIEKNINQNHVNYIPKNKIAEVSKNIESGCLIFITTSKLGLDFAHVGISENSNGVLKMIHASSTGKKVMETPVSLAEYLSKIQQFTGIAVLQLTN